MNPMPDILTTQMLIGGQWLDGDGHIGLINPSTGEPLAEVARGTAAHIDAAVAAARSAFDGGWGTMPAADRGRLLMRLSALVTAHAEALAGLEAMDVGKPLGQADADVAALARYLEFYAGAADKLHGETIPYKDGFTVYTLREALGVTAHIIPWNYPLQIIGRSVVAALSVGNAVVLKPAEDACLTALAFGKLAEQAGLPAGALNIVPGTGEDAGAPLAAHPDIDHVSFTGSFDVGVRVQQAAAVNVVPVTLELGGKSPQILFDDAKLDKAVPVIVNSGIQNAGQTCSAGSRILVQRSIMDAATDRLAAAYSELTVGPALDNLRLGPLVSPKQKAIVDGYIQAARDAGFSQLGTGQMAESLPAGGCYVAPTLWQVDDPAHKLAQEEVFGPLQVLIPFDDEADAIRIANGTDFGLAAGVWTQNGARQMRMVKALKSGQVFINNYGAGGGVELPFGGVKRSGYGREKGFEALYSFTALKTVAAFHGES